jgi:hypothetical protein
MATAGALRMNWMDRLGGWRRRGAVARAPIMASRDLPTLEPMTLPALPRSPEALPDEALIFARGAAATRGWFNAAVGWRGRVVCATVHC